MKNEKLSHHILNQSMEESFDNIISASTAEVLSLAGLVKKEYISGGRKSKFKCLVMFEGSDEFDYRDKAILRVAL